MINTLDSIDACVFLGTLFEENEECDSFIATIGYKLRNKGQLTIPIIGEIFANTFLKISENIADHYERKAFIQKTVDFFDRVIMDLLKKDRLEITKMAAQDFQHIGRIKELDYAITDDDAIHISSVIVKKCQRFITIDKVLLRPEFRSRIKKEFGLIITEPLN